MNSSMNSIEDHVVDRRAKDIVASWFCRDIHSAPQLITSMSHNDSSADNWCGDH